MRVLGRRLYGLAAVLVILGLIVGLPWVLFQLGASPFALGSLSVESVFRMLTAPDDGTLLLALVKVVAWISWAILTISLLIETVAQIRGIKAPKLPGFRLSQGAARRLVSAAALLFVSMPLLANTAHAAPPTEAVITATTSPGSASTKVHQAAETATPEASPSTIRHQVTRGETLWSIAERYLGDGHRFAELVDLNPDVLHGKATFLRPGWVLKIPAPDHAAADHIVVTVTKGDNLSRLAQQHLGDADRYPEIFEASKNIIQPGGYRLTNPDQIDVGWRLRIPLPAAGSVEEQESAPAAGSVEEQESAPAAGSVEEAAQDSPAAAAPADEDADLTEDSAWRTVTAAGVGTLLAAGVVALLARRRRLQQQHRRPGRRLPMPVGRTAAAEQDLRSAADPLSVELVDEALRGMAQYQIDHDQPLPEVRAARLTAEAFDLYLATPADLPAPWLDQHTKTVWTLDAASARTLADHATDETPAPYPALVTIGHDEENGHVLLNLEHLGALRVVGHEAAAREVLAALAIELATSAWADDLQVTIVGAFADLEDALQTGRIRYVPTLGHLVDEVSVRAAADRTAMTVDGATSLNEARAKGIAPDAWAPEIVMLAGELTPRQQNMLESILTEHPRVAIAAVTYACGVGEWELQLQSDGGQRAVIAPIGLQVTPQRIPSDQYDHLMELVTLADVDELEIDAQAENVTLETVRTVQPVDDEPAAPASSMPTITAQPPTLLPPYFGDFAGYPLPSSLRDALVEEEPPSQQHLDEPEQEEEAPVKEADSDPQPLLADPLPGEAAPHSGPRILMLGPVDLINAVGKVEPSKKARLLEYAAYLALHPGASFRSIDDAIWPDRRNEDNLNTRNPATSKLRRWFGQDTSGAEYLPRHQAGEGYGFTTGVTTDILDWDALMAGNPLSAPTENLEKALLLVRGVPFEGTHPKRYAWAEPVRQRLISEIVDASYELTRRRLMEGKWRSAEQAVVVGLRVEPAHESLWRLRILAAHESRNPAAEREAIDRLLAITDQLECDLEPETEQLLAALTKTKTDFDQLIANAL